MDRETASSVPRWAMVLILAFALLCGGAAGWKLARADTGPHVPGHTEFVATVDSVDPDGLRACLSPIDPTLVERFGSVCGRVFVTRGLEIAASQRVHVEWFSVVTRDDGESVEAILLSPLSG